MEALICLAPWQPAPWLARKRLVELSEHACDMWALEGQRICRRLSGSEPLVV
jgi:hypothetical protein